MTKTEKEEAVTRYQKEIELLQQRIDILSNPNRGKVEPKLKYSISLLDNMERYIRDAPVETKIKLLGSIFPEKIEFDGKNYRTTGYNKVLDLIYQQTKELREPKKVSGERFDSFPTSVPRARVENVKYKQISLNLLLFKIIHKHLEHKTLQGFKNLVSNSRFQAFLHSVGKMWGKFLAMWGKSVTFAYDLNII